MKASLHTYGRTVWRRVPLSYLIINLSSAKNGGGSMAWEWFSAAGPGRPVRVQSKIANLIHTDSRL